MSFFPTEEANPFQAPQTRIGADLTFLDSSDLGDAEQIRRIHINHERSIRTFGTIGYILAFLCLLFTTIFLIVIIVGMPFPKDNRQNLPPGFEKLIIGFVAVFYLVLGLICGALGFGLRRLQVWARWVTIVLVSFSLLYPIGLGLVMMALSDVVLGLTVLSLGSLIPGYLLYLMLAPKSWMIFSATYKQVIFKTPHVKPQTSLFTKIAVVILLAFILIAAIYWFSSSQG